MIKPEEGVGAPLPEPSTGTNKPKDHNIIDMYPEFVGFLEDLGGIEPKVDDIIKVNFKNPNIKTKIFGNGIIVAMGEAVTKISDVEINENVLAQLRVALTSLVSPTDLRVARVWERKQQ